MVGWMELPLPLRSAHLSYRFVDTGIDNSVMVVQLVLWLDSGRRIEGVVYMIMSPTGGKLQESVFETNLRLFFKC